MSKRPPPPGPRPIAVLAVACLALLVGRRVAVAQAPPALRRGPYLQLLTSHSVTIVWQTDLAAACKVTIRPLNGAPTTITGKTATTCAVAVEGLAPGTAYAYIPRAGNTPLTSESVFRTDDPAATQYTFLVVGDHGDHNSSTQIPVRDGMVATPADFMISTGDMIYPDGAPEDFDPKFFLPYAALVRRLVFWPCIGNHDDHTLDGAPWRDAFWTPANNPERDEDYYSFAYGNAHVVVLESNKDPIAPGSAQYEFLDRELGGTPARWKIVVWHHPVYSSGTTHGSDLELRANLVPLLDTHQVDLVFNGHEHNYERTHAMRGDQVVPPAEGTVYITTGGGGADLDPFGPLGTFTAAAEMTFHFMRVAVDGATLRADMIHVDGTVGDSVTLVKPTGTTITTTVTTTTGILPTTTTLALCAAGAAACPDDDPCTVDACDARTGTCLHTAVPGCCRADAGCDDGDDCTVDACAPTRICGHEPVRLHAGALLDPALGVAACREDHVPHAIARLLGQASRLAERATQVHRPGRARALLRLAMRKIDLGGRKVTRAADDGRVSARCAAGLDTLIRDSWALPGRCLVRSAVTQRLTDQASRGLLDARWNLRGVR